MLSSFFYEASVGIFLKSNLQFFFSIHHYRPSPGNRLTVAIKLPPSEHLI